MFLAFVCEEMRLKVALLCAAYRTAWRKRFVVGGAVSLLFTPLLAHSFVRLIYNVVLADSGRWGRCVILAGGVLNEASLGFGTLLAR